jgi:formylglycine-generating enzyme
MENLEVLFEIDDSPQKVEMIYVEGTRGDPYPFGGGGDGPLIHIEDFFISTYPVTQTLWKAVIGTNPSHFRGEDNPVEYVSWNIITEPGGFLDRINAARPTGGALPAGTELTFRLPSETEWEYAARGGKHWRDGFAHSGSNNVNEVAWFKDNSGKRTHAVGEKAPNQLGIYDMNGNVWEWCMDLHCRDLSRIPLDGSPFLLGGEDRILRGGCHHNWAMHCRVDNRYSIMPDAADECIGFRIVLTL